MKYILNCNCSLRGWKNRPYNISVDNSPMMPIKISEQLSIILSAPFEYSGGNTEVDKLIQMGVVNECGENDRLREEQQYMNYGCLYFETVVFSITGKCNYNCMHCSMKASSGILGEFSFEQIEQMLDEIKECGLRNLILIGGEPLVRKDFLQVVDAVISRGLFVVQIFTNGSLITSNLLDELEKRGLKPQFMISFDGIGYHDKMRGVKGAEKNFYEKVELLHSRDYDISVNMCFTKESIGSLWDSIEMLANRGVSSLTVYAPVDCGAWEDKYDEQGAPIDLVGEEYTKVVEKFVADDYPLDLNLYGFAYFIRSIRKFILFPKWRYDISKADTSLACKTFFKELNISPEGILSPCYSLMADDHIREEMPDITKIPLKQAITDSPFTKLIEHTAADIAEHNPKCRKCEYLSLCGGGCRMSAYEKTGDFLSYEPQMCVFFEGGYLEKFRAAAKRGHEKRLRALFGSIAKQ